MQSPEISIVLPIYNVEQYLARCLDSILSQTFTDFEIICIDDCGSDRSMDIARAYRDRYPDRIRCVASEKNAGLGGARDKGIAAAKGEYLAFVDSDDMISKDYLETYFRAAERDGVDIVAGGSTRIEGEKRISFPGIPEDPWYCWVNVSACSKLFRTAFLREHRIDFRGVRTYEDAPYIYRCLANEPRITVIRHDGYYYFQNPGSITTSRGNDRLHLHREYRETLIAMYRETEFPEKDREILTYIMASQLITNLLFNGQHAGRREMEEACAELEPFLHELDPDLRDNRFISLKIPLSEPRLNKQATWLILRLRRVKLSAAVFGMVSVLPRIR